MNQNVPVHDDEDEVKTDDQGWGWWMILPVVALGLLVYQIADACQMSVFDEEDD